MKTLKFPLILAFVISTTFSAGAQVSFGVKGGLNFSKTKITPSSNNYNPKIKAGINIGLLADYDFTEFIGLQSSLSYSVAGYRQSYSTDLAKIKSKTHLNTLQLPVHLAYKINFSPEVKVVFHAGPYGSYIFAGKKISETTIDGEDTTLKENLYGEDGKTKRFDVGVGFGGGIELRKLFFDLGYDWGLVNLIKEAKDGNSLRTRNMYVNIGYRF